MMSSWNLELVLLKELPKYVEQMMDTKKYN